MHLKFNETAILKRARMPQHKRATKKGPLGVPANARPKTAQPELQLALY